MKKKHTGLIIIPVLLLVIAAAVFTVSYLHDRADIVLNEQDTVSTPAAPPEPVASRPEIAVPVPEVALPVTQDAITPETLLPPNEAASAPAEETPPAPPEKEPEQTASQPPKGTGDDAPTGTVKDGTRIDGKIYIEGFGWIEDNGGGTDVEIWEATPNGNIIGY